MVAARKVKLLVTGQEHQRLASLGILESDASQMFGIVLAADNACKCDSLIADDALAAIYRSRIDAPKPRVRLGMCHTEGLCLMQHVKPSEAQIAPIHDVDRPGFQHQDVEHIDIPQLSVGDADKTGNVAAQVEQRMHLHRRLGGAKQRPGKQRQTQVDGRRVQLVGRVLQLDAEAVAEVAELLGTDEGLHVAVATMSIDDAGERGPSQKIHQLGEQGLARQCSKSTLGELPPKIDRDPILPFKSTSPFIDWNPASVMAFHERPIV